MTIERYASHWVEEIKDVIRDMQLEVLRHTEESVREGKLEELIEKYKNGMYLMVVDGLLKGLIIGEDVEMGLSDKKCFHEVFFYIRKESRMLLVRFLDKIEKTLKADGYKFVSMVFLHNFMDKRLIRLYTKLEYKPLETHLLKKLG
jgi:hypothetical protein